MQQRSQKTQRGFTLLELLLVIAVMGILVAILMPVIGKVRRSAIERKAQAQKAALKMAITTYFAHHKEWPISENDSSRDPSRDLTYGGNGNERRVAAILTRLETPGDDLPPLIQRDDYREENDEIINPSTGAPLQITFDLDYNGVITNRSNNAVMCPVLVE